MSQSWSFALSKAKPQELASPFGFSREGSALTKPKSSQDKKTFL